MDYQDDTDYYLDEIAYLSEQFGIRQERLLETNEEAVQMEFALNNYLDNLETQARAVQDNAERRQERKKLTWTRKMDARRAVKMVGSIADTCECELCGDKGDTRVIHNGEENDETKNDSCKKILCWDCLYRSITNQSVSWKEKKIFPKCPMCNTRICYRVTKEDGKIFATKLRPFNALMDEDIVKMAIKNNLVRIKRKDGCGGYFYKCIPLNDVPAFKKTRAAHGEKWVGGLRKSVADRGGINWFWSHRQFGMFVRYNRVGTWTETRDALLLTSQGKKLNKKRLPTFKRRVVLTKPRKNFK